MNRSLLPALAAAALATACAHAPGVDRASHAIAFLHADVVPMDTERVLADHSVVVVDGRITAVGPTATTRIPRGATRIDARGRHLLPALADMHVHVEGESFNAMLAPEAIAASQDPPYADFLFPYVANGVTTVQVLSGTRELLPVRRRIAEGGLVAPRLVLARMIDGPGKAWPPPMSDWVADADEARAAVRRAKADGYDAMKVYSFLDKDAYDAVVATTKELHMDVVGHVPYSLSVEYVVDAGQRLISHSEEIAKHAHGDYSPAKIDHYADRLAQGHVVITPTLITTRRILECIDDPGSLYARPETAYMHHPMQAGVWHFIQDKLYAPIPAAARKKIGDDFEYFQRPFTRAFHDRGGRLMAGTDALLPRVVPGFSLHEELRELVDVGLTPFEALRTSTTVPYEYLGEADEAGTIAVGKRTDLILVDGDPLADIAAASRISGVLMRGRWIDRARIDTRMQAIRDAYRASP